MSSDCKLLNALNLQPLDRQGEEDANGKWEDLRPLARQGEEHQDILDPLGLLNELTERWRADEKKKESVSLEALKARGEKPKWSKVVDGVVVEKSKWRVSNFKGPITKRRRFVNRFFNRAQIEPTLQVHLEKLLDSQQTPHPLEALAFVYQGNPASEDVDELRKVLQNLAAEAVLTLQALDDDVNRGDLRYLPRNSTSATLAKMSPEIP